MTPILVLATQNRDKLNEMQRLTAALPVIWRTLPELGISTILPETGSTFLENALQKAIGYARLSGYPVVADDSGLEVDALDGRPGLETARYAGSGSSYPQKWATLLAELKAVPWEKRTARFQCVLAYAQPDGQYWHVSGSCSGYIALQPQGLDGFGFDPLFYTPLYNTTFAELTTAQKDAISHRGLATQKLIPSLLHWLDLAKGSSLPALPVSEQ